VTLNTSVSAVIYHSCTSTPLYQSAHDILKCLVQPIPKILLGAKFKKTGHGTLTMPRANIWFILLAYKICWLLLQPFRRYVCEHRNWKWPCILGVHWNFTEIFGIRIRESRGYHLALIVWSYI